MEESKEIHPDLPGKLDKNSYVEIKNKLARNSTWDIQTLRDITRRARGGIFIYPFVWFITTLWAGVYQKTPEFFIFNSTVLILLMILRTGLDLVIVKSKPKTSLRLAPWLIRLILVACFHWGLVSGWIIFIGDYPKLHYPFIIILAAMAMGGTVTLSIAKHAGLLYPFLMFGPSILFAIITGGGENYVLAMLAMLATIYILDASRVSASDYQRARYHQKIAEQRAVMLEKLSITDPLTRLKNRAYFNAQLQLQWKRSARLKVPITIMMIDLDHFKAVNDTYGHICGDQCLQMVATALKTQMLRETDIVARYGGEEFVVLLPGTPLDGAKMVAQSIVKGISELNFMYEKQRIQLHCSIGIATAYPDYDTQETAQSKLDAADKALYQAKDAGRNQWCVEQ